MSTAILPLGSVEILPSVQKTDDLRGEVDALLEAIRNQELRLATSYVRFARLLLQVRSTHEWQDWGFRSWGAYMADIGKRISKARSQIYNYITVTETLEPLLEPDVLESMGISKAGELRRYVKGSLGQSIPENLLAIATDHTKDIDELRAAVFEALHQKPDPKGRYYDFLGGFYCSEDERKELEQAFSLACRVDPPIPQHTPEPEQKKEVLLRWAREFVSTYGDLLSLG